MCKKGLELEEKIVKRVVNEDMVGKKLRSDDLETKMEEKIKLIK